MMPGAWSFLHPAGRNAKAFPQWPRKCLFIFGARILNDGDVLGRGAFFALRDVKSNAVAIFQALEPGPLDPGVMDEDLLPIFRLNETVALFVVEPLYSSIGHRDTLLSESYHSFILRVSLLELDLPLKPKPVLVGRTYDDWQYFIPSSGKIKTCFQPDKTLGIRRKTM
jgi:hypothetical protein